MGVLNMHYLRQAKGISNYCQARSLVLITFAMDSTSNAQIYCTK